jgi:dCTP deaminase
MSVMPDSWIRQMATKERMIEPFTDNLENRDAISYGVSSYGYDARVADEFKIFTNVDNVVVDPKEFSTQGFVDRKTDICVVPPNSFVLARTVEFFRIPRDVLVICLGKSTYARCGIIVNVTPLHWSFPIPPHCLRVSMQMRGLVNSFFLRATVLVKCHMQTERASIKDRRV